MDKKVITTMLLTLIATSGILYTTSLPQAVENNLMGEYQAWKNIHKKNFGNAQDNYRFQIFSQNYQIVKEHNKKYEAGQETFELGLNEFADLTNQEFQQIYLTAKPSAPEGVQQVQYPSNVRIPTEVDLRNAGLVSRIKNQGSCGACWAFASTGSIEGVLRLSGVKDVELSEQELVDCVDGGISGQTHGCGGGFSWDSIDYVSKNGLAIESQYPYTAADETCKASKTTTRYSVSSRIAVAQFNEAALVEALAVRPVTAALNAGGIFFQLYKKGIYNRACDGSEDALNHEVIAIGYGSDYILLKNSWGTGWGEQGVFRFARNGKPEGQCGIYTYNGYPKI